MVEKQKAVRQAENRGFPKSQVKKIVQDIRRNQLFQMLLRFQEMIIEN